MSVIVLEELILSVAEKTMLGAGFFYLLRNLVENMNCISINLKDFGGSLNKISNTLLKIDMRVEQLEKRIRDIEDGNA